MEELYRLQGFYESQDIKKELDGWIEADEEGNITGIIIDLSNGKNKEDTLKGLVLKLSDIEATHLNFRVSIQDEDKPDLEFELNKTTIDQDFAGKYKGICTPREKIVTKTDAQKELDHIMKLTEQVPQQEKKQNYAELTLKKSS